jgi:hypothetical protein
MGTFNFRCLTAGVFFCVLYVFSFSANADERDRALRMCQTDHRLVSLHDCQCWADAFVKAKPTLGPWSKFDEKVITAVSDKCRRTDRLDLFYQSCVARPGMYKVPAKTYCKCFIDELAKRPYSPEKSHEAARKNMAAQNAAQKVCSDKYYSQLRPSDLSREERIKKNSSDVEFKKATEGSYLICRDSGVAPGQTAEKTATLQYMNSFCQFEEEIRDTAGAVEWDRIIGIVNNMQEHINQTHGAFETGLSESARTLVQKCMEANQQCRATCEKNLNNMTCGCAQAYLACLYMYGKNM